MLGTKKQLAPDLLLVASLERLSSPESSGEDEIKATAR